MATDQFWLYMFLVTALTLRYIEEYYAHFSPLSAVQFDQYLIWAKTDTHESIRTFRIGKIHIASTTVLYFFNAINNNS